MLDPEKLIEDILEAKPLTLDDFDVVKARDIVKMLKTSILVRRGEVIDDRVAEERARNIAASLMFYAIKA